MSQSPPDIEEVKKCLKDANLLDEVMDSDDMMAYYSVIKSSKDMADKESQNRTLDSQSSIEMDGENVLSSEMKSTPKLQSFKAKQWSTQKRQLDVSVANVTPNRGKDLQNRLSDIDIFECPPSKKPPLDIIYHKPKFLGPYYCLEKLKNLSVNERMKCISSYHLALNAELQKVAQKSLYFAPWPVPIRANMRYNDSIRKEAFETSSQMNESDFETSISTEETYTSRVGRQTKRKIYTEASMEENETKKTKQFKRTNPKKLSNAEIMSRSPLFADSPKSRPDKLISKLDDDFEIAIVSPKFQTQIGSDANVDSDSVKKASTPAMMASKGIRKTQVIQPVKTQIASTSSSLGTPGRETRSRTSSLSVNLETETTPRKIANPKTLKKTKCPICSDLYSTSEIQEHASTCGLTSELEIENNLPPNDLAAMTCHVCDKVLLLNSEYEVHVKECIKRNSS